MAEINLELMLTRLREIVGDRGPSQVARDTGAAPSSVSMYLNGTRSPKVAFLSKVAVAYGVNLEWLLGYPDAVKYPGLPDPNPEDEIVILSRAAKNMTPEDRQKLLDMAKLMFREAFDESHRKS